MLKRNHSAEPTRLPRHVTLTRIAANAYAAAWTKPPSPAVRSIERPMHTAAGTDTAPLRSKAHSSTASSERMRPGAKPFAVSYEAADISTPSRMRSGAKGCSFSSGASSARALIVPREASSSAMRQFAASPTPSRRT